MLALVIDTSCAAVTAGVVDISEIDVPQGGASEGDVWQGDPAHGDVLSTNAVLAERVTINAKGHGELLAPSIRAVLKTADVSMPDLDAVIAGVGPGPFTGLRVGLVTGAALCDAMGIAAYGVCSLDAIAVAAGHPGPLLVAADARRREVYWARYRRSSREQYPAVSRPVDVAAAVAKTGDGGSATVAMAGAGARLYAEVFALPMLDCDYPTVAGLAAAGAERVRSAAPSERLTPMYLRRPDAVVPGERKPVTR